MSLKIVQQKIGTVLSSNSIEGQSFLIVNSRVMTGDLRCVRCTVDVIRTAVKDNWELGKLYYSWWHSAKIQQNKKLQRIGDQRCDFNEI